MAVIKYKCTDCDREIELIERPQSLETIGRCIVTNKCRGNLYRTDRLEDYVVGRFPGDVTGLTNWIQRKVVYDHTQSIADSIWTVVHNLGVNPSVQVIVNREEVIDGVVTATTIEIQPDTITIVDENTLVLTFDRQESGIAQIVARSTRSTELVEEADPGITYLPVTVDGILTLGINVDSNQFPATSATTCTVRLYFLDQEELTETAFDSAVFNDYEVSTSVDSTSAWSDTAEIFVNGDVYTIVTLDIGDPVNEFQAPSAGAILFNAGTTTSGFPYDQAPNTVVMLSSSPHLNADKNRNYIFRPDLEVGPALGLDSFIFANTELVIDQSKTERAFPPVYSITAAQDKGYVAPVAPAAPAFFVAMSTATDFEGGATLSYVSDSDITTWTELFPIPGNIGGSPAQAFFSPTDVAYMSGISTWVGTSSSTASWVFYSTDNGTTWTTGNFGVVTGRSHNTVDVGEVSGTEYAVALTNSTDGGMGVVYTLNGIDWFRGNAGVSVSPGTNGIGIRWTGDRWIALDSANRYWTMTDPLVDWPAEKTGPTADTSPGAIHSVNGGARVLVGTDGGTQIYYSDDDGDTWNTPTFNSTIEAPFGVNNANMADVKAFADDGNGVVIAVGGLYNDGGYYQRSTDNGSNWEQGTFIGRQNGMAGHSIVYDPDYGFVCGGAALFGSPALDAVLYTSPTGADGTWTERISTAAAVHSGQPTLQALSSQTNNQAF